VGGGGGSYGVDRTGIGVGGVSGGKGRLREWMWLSDKDLGSRGGHGIGGHGMGNQEWIVRWVVYRVGREWERGGCGRGDGGVRSGQDENWVGVETGLRG
jgi:hypothetical protein